MINSLHKCIFFMPCYSLSSIYQICNWQIQTILCFSLTEEKKKSITIFTMKILCNIVKECTYHELKFVDGGCLWFLLHKPSGSDSKLLDIQGHHMQQPLAVKGGSMSGCFLYKAVLKMRFLLHLFYHHLAKGTAGTIGRIFLSGYCSIRVRAKLGCILFSFWSYFL